MKTACWMMFGMLLTVQVGLTQDVKPVAVPPPATPAPPPLPSSLPTTPVPRRSIPPSTPAVSVQAPAATGPAIAPTPVQPYQQVVAPRAVNPAAYSSITGAVPGQLTALKWDSESKEYTSKRGESEAHFTFWLTNITSAEVSINSVRTSCGCTVAKLPSTPWVVPPAGSGPIDVTVNLAGKSGTITKAVTVESTAGAKSLLVKVNIEGGSQPFAAQSNMSDADRLKNMQRSLADRQIVFKEQDCAKCHADPAKGQTDGRQIYAGVCSTCHDSHIRASMVPDLKTLTHPTDAEYWRNWINYGRAGSMMPAFAQSEGGPLSESQVNSLVNFLVTAYPSRQVPGDLQKSAALRQAPVVSPAVAVPAH